MDKKIVIFDLDGTLALIDKRRDLATKDGKMNWDVFFDPDNIDLDTPNQTVIDMANLLHSQGYLIYIFSGRSDKTEDATIAWLDKHNVNYDLLQMRPQGLLYKPDNDLKQGWLDTITLGKAGKDRVAMVFDDRQQVVDMWRKNGLTTFQVADGDF